MKTAMKPQVRRLGETAAALRNQTSTYFSITRLTGLKSLCREPELAAQFVLHLAERTLRRVEDSGCPAYTEPVDWQRYQALILEAVTLMKESLCQGKSNLSALRTVLRKVESVQTDTGKEIWGHPTRNIHSQDVLVIEGALQCLLAPEVAPFWAYQTARDYVEQYNPSYGTGLIPESIPMLEDVIGFWIGRI